MKVGLQSAAIIVIVALTAIGFSLALPWVTSAVQRSNCNAVRWADLGETSIKQACGE